MRVSTYIDGDFRQCYGFDCLHVMCGACSWKSVVSGHNPSPACQAMLDQMSAEIGGYNVYNICTPASAQHWHLSLN